MRVSLCFSACPREGLFAISVAGFSLLVVASSPGERNSIDRLSRPNFLAFSLFLRVWFVVVDLGV